MLGLVVFLFGVICVGIVFGLAGYYFMSDLLDLCCRRVRK